MSGDREPCFLREISDEELIFLAPEVITRFFRPQKTSKEDNPIDVYSADLYSLSMVMLFMATLGEAQEEISKIKSENLQQGQGQGQGQGLSLSNNILDNSMTISQNVVGMTTSKIDGGGGTSNRGTKSP